MSLASGLVGPVHDLGQRAEPVRACRGVADAAERGVKAEHRSAAPAHGVGQELSAVLPGVAVDGPERCPRPAHAAPELLAGDLLVAPAEDRGELAVRPLPGVAAVPRRLRLARLLLAGALRGLALAAAGTCLARAPSATRERNDLRPALAAASRRLRRGAGTATTLACRSVALPVRFRRTGRGGADGRSASGGLPVQQSAAGAVRTGRPGLAVLVSSALGTGRAAVRTAAEEAALVRLRPGAARPGAAQALAGGVRRGVLGARTRAATRRLHRSHARGLAGQGTGRRRALPVAVPAG